MNSIRSSRNSLSSSSLSQSLLPLPFSRQKKSQQELLGFAVVVMLVAIGLIFVIGFYVLNPTVDSRTTYLDKQIATNMNDALLETTTTCRSLSVRDLLLACVNDNEAICPADDTTTGPESVKACDYLSSFITHRLHSTLDVWGYDYEYSIRYDTTSSQNYVIPLQTNHPSRVGCEAQRSALPLAGANRPVLIYLDIFACKN